MNPIPAAMANGETDLMNVFDNIICIMRKRIDSANPPGLAQGSTTNTSVKAANTTKYFNKGLPTSKTTFEVAFPTSGNSTFTGPYDVTPNIATIQERCYAITLTGTTPGMIAGPQTTVASAGQAPLPEYPWNSGTVGQQYTDGVTIIGYLRITVAAGATGFEAN